MINKAQTDVTTDSGYNIIIYINTHCCVSAGFNIYTIYFHNNNR